MYIYIDIWLFVCTLFHFYAVENSFCIFGKKCSILRNISYSCLNSIVDVFALWFYMKKFRLFVCGKHNDWSLIVLILVLYIGMCVFWGRVVLKIEKLQELVKIYLGMILFSFLLAGELVLVQEWNIVRNVQELIVFLLVTIILTKLCIRLATRTRLKQSLVIPVQVHKDDVSVCCKAFYDSGNGLYEPYFQRPVILASLGVLERLHIGDENCILVPYYSLGESNGLLKAYAVDWIELYYKNVVRRVENIMIADARDVFLKNEDYDLILHRMMQE